MIYRCEIQECLCVAATYTTVFEELDDILAQVDVILRCLYAPH